MSTLRLTTEESSTVLVSQESVIKISEVGAQGPEGPEGPPGRDGIDGEAGIPEVIDGGNF